MLIKNLTNMCVGESAQVALLLNKGSIRTRLEDLGLIPGTRIHCIHKSPYGDPVAYEIRGAVIALRSDDAKGVLLNNND
ncbi:MAG: ferrous iron transport protein A [Oscillospiraceae bacterium]|nr:ferrous iron transport protein A [Oscillospiraceae bacterium]